MQKSKNQLNRRRFLFSAGALGFSGLFPVLSWGTEKETVTADVPVLKAGPYIQSKGKGEMTIRWITSFPCYSWVEYGKQAGQTDKKAESVSDGLIDAYQTVHAITIKKLPAGETCYYRICSKVIEKFNPYKIIFGETYTSPVYSFNPIDKQVGKVSFLVFNDIHDRPESFGHLLQFQKSDKKDFILLNGDIFSDLEDENQIVEHLLNPLSDTFRETPFIFSRGNHETRGKFARHLPDYFNRGEKGFYYSFMAGPAYCIVLDSGEDKPDDNAEYFGLVKFDPYRMKQQEWLEKEIKKKSFKKAKYKLVFCHIPPFYSGDGHGTLQCRELWNGLFNEAKIDLLIAGHTHVYGIHQPEKGQHNYPIVIGGGPKDGARTVIEVNADSHSLHLILTADDGKVKGELTI